MNMSAMDLVKLLGLEELPEEGGYFKKTYQSAEKLNLERGLRPAGDAIYYLITPDQFSGLHRLKCDEMWHFYAGDPVEMVIFNETDFKLIELGNTNFKFHLPQFLIPSHFWQGTKLKEGGSWALIGTNAFPGYDQADFELANSEILKIQTNHAEIISRYVK